MARAHRPWQCQCHPWRQAKAQLHGGQEKPWRLSQHCAMQRSFTSQIMFNPRPPRLWTRSMHCPRANQPHEAHPAINAYSTRPLGQDRSIHASMDRVQAHHRANPRTRTPTTLPTQGARAPEDLTSPASLIRTRATHPPPAAL